MYLIKIKGCHNKSSRIFDRSP
ncbi:hypothetical protein CGLO_13396 [Colletotrichum gloeosporioides Cg-14]|uniref:Uncharacterized protein n=1 Tax=Colletotrichum gloeosporioides (strain Cg-14) TaxID=1237896 RepID=T0L7A4_COLGC|nr:hypothetical protein CGLO_13396 [Colletotrichum gloeosporioides Cg-14]